jgi:hypothetical protein
MQGERGGLVLPCEPDLGFDFDEDCIGRSAAAGWRTSAR